MGLFSRGVRWFGRLGRRFVFLKDTHNFAEKSLFLFFRVRTCLAFVTVLRPVGRWRKGFVAKSQKVRKEAAHPAGLITGLTRFGARHEGGRVCFWTGRGCEPVG